MVVGGVAVTLQGYVRFTEDVDILLAGEKRNIEAFLNALADYGEGFAQELEVADFTDDEGAIRIVEETEQCQIDIFIRMAGLTYVDIIADADLFDLGNHRIPYASKLSLIRWKEKSVREKDRLDALALRRLLADPESFD